MRSDPADREEPQGAVRMGLPATKRTNLHEKYGASESAGNVSACCATGFQSKAHRFARKVRLPLASIALSHGINANLVHKWRREGSSAPPALEGPAFVPVPLPPAACAPAPDIRIEVRRGTTSVSVTWPLEAADQCAVWMRELLK